MNPRSLQATRNLVGSVLWVFLAEALVLPTGLVTVAVLTRRLGPADYGLFVLAFMLVGWIEWTLTSVFARATIKLVGDAEDWQAVGATVLRLQLVASSIVALFLWLMAPVVATLLNEAVLTSYLRWFAVDIPLFSLAQAHRDILVGIGSFRQRAVMRGSRWIAKMLFIVFLVEIGLSVRGAILGSIGASLVQLVLGRSFLRLSLFYPSRFPLRQLWTYAAPLFLFALSIRLFDKLDLFALKTLGGAAAQAGIYGAAQSLTLIPSIFAFSISPILLSSLGHLLHAGDSRSAKEMSRNALRAIVGLLPFAGLIAGAAPEIVSFIFGPKFLPAAPLLAVLIFGAVALMLIWVSTAILTAASKPTWTFALTGPLVPLAIGGHLLSIPRWGAIGAAWVTTVLSSIGAVAAVLTIYRLWRVLPPLPTLCRSTLVCGVAYALAHSWPTPGALLLLKLPAIGLIIPFTFFVLGEFSEDEITRVRTLLGWQTAAG